MQSVRIVWLKTHFILKLFVHFSLLSIPTEKQLQMFYRFTQFKSKFIVFHIPYKLIVLLLCCHLLFLFIFAAICLSYYTLCMYVCMYLYEKAVITVYIFFFNKVKILIIPVDQWFSITFIFANNAPQLSAVWHCRWWRKFPLY